MFDETLSMGDLQERYPSPGEEMVVGESPLIHHCYAFGRMYVCMPAVREALEKARATKDTGAIAHLNRHVQAHTEWMELQKAWRDLVNPKRAAVAKR